MPQFADYPELYLVTGTTSGNGTSEPAAGFVIMPVPPDVANFSSFGTTYYYPGSGGWDTTAWLAAVKQLFDGKTYGDGTTSVTISSPVIKKMTQVQNDVTPPGA